MSGGRRSAPPEKQAGTAITLVGNRTKQRARLHGGGWLDDLEARLRRGKADDCSEQTGEATLTTQRLLARRTELNANLHVVCIESSLFLRPLRAVYSR